MLRSCSGNVLSGARPSRFSPGESRNMDPVIPPLTRIRYIGNAGVAGRARSDAVTES